MRRTLVWLAAGAAVAAGYCWYVNRLAYDMTYRFDTVIRATPAAEGLAFTPVTVDADGRHVTGWYIPAKTSGAPAVLYCHGNAGNISTALRLYKARLLHELGLGVLLFDYGGFGDSRGPASEPGYAADARAMFFALMGQGVPAEKIVLYGESLGTAVAVDLAAEVNAGGLVLESPFTSLADMAREIAPWLPAGFILHGRYDTVKRVGLVKMPLLVIHSPNDQLVPFAQGRRVFEAAAEPKDFVELSGGHSDGFKVAEQAYAAGLSRFLRTRLGFDTRAGAYIGKPPAGAAVEHIDGAKLNFSVIKNKG